MRDFEDYCWRDFVTDEVRYIYSTYVRERAVGPRPALVVVHPGAAPCGEDWQKAAGRLLADARQRRLPVIHSLPPGSKTVKSLAPKGGELIVGRPCESAFFSADFERAMRNAGAGSLVLCGGPTSAALRATAVDGKSFGYKVVIAEETVGDVSAHLHAMALFDLAHKYADVMSYEELKEQLA